MNKGRLEAFSDGVLAIVITIMVLELKVPEHTEHFADLQPLLPVFLSYVLSFLYVGIYWNNHHHLLHAASHSSASIMWANLHLLFWLSLIPFVAGWMGSSSFAPAPTALYGVVMLMAATAYTVLQHMILRSHASDSPLVRAFGSDRKGKLSLLTYLVAIPTAFVVPWIAGGLYALVALVWLIPDKRIEAALKAQDVT